MRMTNVLRKEIEMKGEQIQKTDMRFAGVTKVKRTYPSGSAHNAKQSLWDEIPQTNTEVEQPTFDDGELIVISLLLCLATVLATGCIIIGFFKLFTGGL
jgi:hypothetical protein